MTAKFYNDNGSTFFAYGHEFGVSQIILCDSEQSAYDIAIDKSPTIEPDQVIEAYGFYLMQACRYNDQQAKKTAPFYVVSDHDNHGELTSESILFCTGDRLTIGGAFDDKESAIEYALEYISENEVYLIEGYQHQSNASGTGIVNVGHYEWLREATDSEIAEIGDKALADYLENYGNELIDEHKWVMLNGWNGSINSMTYALQSSGELRRGSINHDDSQLEHVHSIFWSLEIELEKCVKIALKAVNANYENKCDDCSECKEWIGTDGRSHCDECGFDPAGDDYDELEALLEATKKAVKRIDTFRDILESDE